MEKLKNSFAFGILIGLILSLFLLGIVDTIVYLVYSSNGEIILTSDVRFAICIISSFLLARKFFRKEGREELGKGFLFSGFIWGAAYVYLFHISPIQSIFFHY